jgi:hypothetical protein
MHKKEVPEFIEKEKNIKVSEGLVFLIDFPKKFSAKTIIKQVKSSNNPDPQNLEKISSKNSEFDKNFIIFSNSGIEFNDLFSNEFMADFLSLLETFEIKKSKYEEDVIIDSEFTFQSILTFEINPYRYSYVNIVTESNYFNEKIDAIHISEKSLIPFFFFQLPIFLASQGHVGKVRGYGFDLFDDIIDHSYDDIWDSKDRFNAVVNEIKRLHDNKEAIIDFYVKNKLRFEKNNQIIVDFPEKNSDRNYFLNLIQQ